MRKPQYNKNNRNHVNGGARDGIDTTNGPVLRWCAGECGKKYVESSMLDAPGGGKSCYKCYPKLVNNHKKFWLEDKHLQAAQAILGLSHPKRNCKHCYGRGYSGTNASNEVIPCSCIDNSIAQDRWKKYVRANADLHSHYKWCLDEDENHETDETNEKGMTGEARRHIDTEVKEDVTVYVKTVKFNKEAVSIVKSGKTVIVKLQRRFNLNYAQAFKFKQQIERYIAPEVQTT